MRPPRQKKIALAASLLGLGLLSLAAFASRDQLREEYWLWRLRSGAEDEKRAAAEQLAGMRSVRAVRPLIEILLTSVTEDRIFVRTVPPSPPPGRPGHQLMTVLGQVDLWTDPPYPAKALAKIGRPAVPALVEALCLEDYKARITAIRTLGLIGEEALEAVPALMNLPQDNFVRFLVHQALARIRGGGGEP